MLNSSSWEQAAYLEVSNLVGRSHLYSTIVMVELSFPYHLSLWLVLIGLLVKYGHRWYSLYSKLTVVCIFV